jgi:hypothetical protein
MDGPASGAVVSLVRPDRIGDIRGEICDLGQFVVSREAAAGWLASHPDGTVHTVEEERIGWAVDAHPTR